MSEKVLVAGIILIVIIISLTAGTLIGAGAMAYSYEAELEYCKNYFDVCWEDLEICWTNLETIENKAGEKK